MGYRIDTLKCYARIAGIPGLASYIGSKAFKNSIEPKITKIDRGDLAAPVYVRIPSSDVLTYWQVFVANEYAVEVNRTPEIIVDAGANIGLAAIYFANRFPHSTVIAIEPEDSNFEMLVRNSAPYENITPIHAALWNENKNISLVDPGLGNSGFMTEDVGERNRESPNSIHSTRGMTVDRIMDEQGIEHIDILKIDIEGAEREVFGEPSRWITRVDSLIVELHERMKPGCTLSFSDAVEEFDTKWTQGENVVVSRRDGCLNAPHIESLESLTRPGQSSSRRE